MLVAKMIKVICFFLLFFLPLPSVLPGNISAQNSSAYIRMHVDDPVAWQQWDSSVLHKAKQENKLIFISSGYYSCHWCHVMRKESFVDKKVASLLNASFIPVKIDREINHSLDSYLIDFMRENQGYAGWPLNVFITPEGYPLTGFVYLPKNKLIDVANRLSIKWEKENKKLNNLARNVYEKSKERNSRLIKISDNDLLFTLMSQLRNSADELEGGVGNQAKFPVPYLMMSLLAIQKQKQELWLEDFIKLSLRQMSEKGLHDAIGGGFFRYTIDQSWGEPHFEKMLYTNAAMIKLYVDAYNYFGDQYWLDVAEETMLFLISEMRREDGGFVSSLSAQDMQGEEGGSYSWDQDEFMNVVRQDKSASQIESFKLVQLSTSEKILPTGFLNSDFPEEIRTNLLAKRKHNPPARDTRFNISWNAYLLSSIIDLIKVTDKPEYQTIAEQLYSRLRKELAYEVKDSGLNNREAKRNNLTLDDYAFSAYAFEQWSRLDLESDQVLSDQALNDHTIVEKMLKDIVEGFVENNGWKHSSDEILPRPGVYRNIKDGDLPSSEVLVLKLLNMLSIKNHAVAARLRALPEKIDVRMLKNPMDYSSFISAKYLKEID